MRMRAGIGVLGAVAAAGFASGQFSLEPVASGFDAPVFVTVSEDDPSRLFVVEKIGRVRLVENGVVDPTPVLDISGRITSDGSRGLLGLALAGDFASSGRFYVNYTVRDATDQLRTFISSFVWDGVNAAPDSGETNLLTIEQPRGDHNGGWLAFGPDGMLYAALGDGGGPNDVDDLASDLGSLLGKVLRLDVSSPGGSLIPADNPFVGVAGAREEIWLYGLRHPWRNSFDRETGDLYLADVGQNGFEEVNVAPAGSGGGQHFGWRCREGFVENPVYAGCTPLPPTGFTDPVYVYSLAGPRCSITGGYVYRGCAVPELSGQYVFGDYCTGEIVALDVSTGAETPIAMMPAASLVSFGEDTEGELFAVSIFGEILRITSDAATDDNGNGIVDSCEICVADTNGDGMLTPADFNGWILAYNNHSAACDQNGDGACTPADFNGWILNYNAGC